MATQAIRWSDNDRYFGRFTYSRAGRADRYRPFSAVLGSGDDDDRVGCSLRLSAFGHTFIVALPPIIKPARKKVPAPSWDAQTVARLGRNWYYDVMPREYGFSLSDGFLNLFLGRQTNDSSTEQRKSYFLPWTQWRMTRHSYYDLAGEEHWSRACTRENRTWATPAGEIAHDEQSAARDTCPTAAFEFDDFDGERIAATTFIEQREWRLGEGLFCWISLFCAAKVRRSLDIHFSAETGKRKGSWKGGTIGHSIDMLPGELHEAAFRRYCPQNGMTYVGRKQ